MSLAEVVATPASSLPCCPGLGLGTSTHFVPFQRTISAFGRELAMKPPAAQTSYADVAATAASTLPLPGAGTVLCVHCCPSHRSTSGLTVVLVKYWPTAQASVAETTATPLRSLVLLLGLGRGACVQKRSFQCSMKFLSPVCP